MKLLSILTGLAILDSGLAIPYSEYILAPKSRTLHPVSVHNTWGPVTNPSALLTTSSTSSPDSNTTTTFHSTSSLTYDFGLNIAGIVSLNTVSTSASNQTIGVTFSESSLWVSNKSSDATADAGKDEILWFEIEGPGVVTARKEKGRGAFRYLTVVYEGTGSIEVGGLEVHYTAMPHWEDDKLGEYTGWFHSDDDLLNRIWYAGAYTNQLCTIDPHYGDALVHIFQINASVSDATNVTWWSNYTITNGSSALVDGAKRDRIVWAGGKFQTLSKYMSIAIPGIVVSTNDVVSVENSLTSLFDIQNPSTGQLPYAGRPFPSGNISYLRTLWPKYKLALHFSLSYIDSTGLMNVTSPADWLRSGMGGHNIEANAILYHTLNQATLLASVLNDTSPSISYWSLTASRIKQAANALLWNNEAGMYIDNETTTLMPQDGNAWAVVSNLTLNASQISSISEKLQGRWTAFGAPAPEAPVPSSNISTISPFITSFELQTHFLASSAHTALALIRRQWGFMLTSPLMTNSTFIEGYSSDGSLHYAPYANDARISHAHGWSTGPTSLMTFYVAGVQVTGKGGGEWRIKPMLGI
ncbi:hypothetical protein N0V83_010605 [Neocucurbitaria cava]|uniref:Cytosolic neutral trehalase n=1 Tax=Neocucurbitaria cava TaxID=798079 RepID=A0A9W8XYW6_9PLEO|nr:hypothetical protein N0V83_010605 [Neocucurbitaria cava]